MRIGIDARLLERKMTGIGRYLDNLVKNISDHDSKNEYFLFTYNGLKRDSYQNINVVSTLFFLPSGIFQKIISPVWMNFILPRFLKKYKIDILFSPNQLLPLIKNSTKNIIVINDLFHLVSKKFHAPIFRYYSNFFISHSVKKSDSIITISESSKADIHRLLGVPTDKIKVIYEAADEKFAPRDLGKDDISRLRKKYNLPERFILYVGVIEKRKNISGIFEIAKFLLKKIDVPIVLFGRIGYGGEVYVKEIKKSENIFYGGFIEDDDLPYIYNLSSIFLFPSLYEGFGIPPLEAMQSGVPVVASNASSLPEVIGDGGIMFSPQEYELFADALFWLLTNPEGRYTLVERGLAQAKKFDFKKTARATVAAFEDVYRTHNKK